MSYDAETISKLIDETSYLEESVTWSALISKEERKNHTSRFLARNDNIWEFIQGERRYLSVLFMMKEVYEVQFPEQLVGSSSQELFPCIEDLVLAHFNLFQAIVRLQTLRPDKVVDDLGTTLLQQLDKTRCDKFAHLYGTALIVQENMKKIINNYKKQPGFAQYLQKCQSDSRANRKSIEDCYTIITQRWTKVEPLIQSIAKNTTNLPEEADRLEKARQNVRTILFGSESVLAEEQNRSRLFEYVENIQSDPELGAHDVDTQRVVASMRNPKVALVHCGKVRTEVKSKLVELHGVLLKDLFVLLHEVPDTNKMQVKYQIFKDLKFPSVVYFGESYGYFREHTSKKKTEFGFFLILNKPEAAMAKFCVDTPDEVGQWNKYLSEGLTRTIDQPTKDDESRIEEAQAKVSSRTQLTQQILSLLQSEDNRLMNQWTQRNLLFQTLLTPPDQIDQAVVNSPHLEDYHEILSAASTTASYIDKNDGKDPILDKVMTQFLDDVLKLKTILTGSGNTIRRSASDMEERKKTPIIRKTETFSTCDRSYEKRNSISISLTNADGGKSTTKAKINERRSFVNMFRGSREKLNTSTPSDLETPELPTGRASNSPGSTVSPQSSIGEGVDHHLLYASQQWSGGPIELEVDSLSQVIALLDHLHYSAKWIAMLTKEIDQRNKELSSKANRLEEERQHQVYSSLASIPSSIASTVHGTDGEGDTIPYGGRGKTAEREVWLETEKLRQQYTKFNKEKAEWEKTYRQEKASLERRKEDLAAEAMRIETKQKDYKVDIQKFQKYLDMHSTRLGVNIESQVPFSSTSDFTRASVLPAADEDHPDSINNGSSLHHNLSITGNKDSVIRPRIPPTVPVSNTGRDLPAHLQGSLVNQQQNRLSKPPKPGSMNLHSMESSDDDSMLNTSTPYSHVTSPPTHSSSAIGLSRYQSGPTLPVSSRPSGGGSVQRTSSHSPSPVSHQPSVTGLPPSSHRTLPPQGTPVTPTPAAPAAGLPLKLAQSKSKPKKSGFFGK